MKVFGFSIGELWKLKKASDQFEKDKKMKADPTISIVKGLKAIAGLALFSGLGGMALFLLEPGVIEAALASAGVNTAYAAIIVLALRGAATAFLNWRKHNPPTPASQNAGPLVLLILALASPAFAQEQAPKSNSVTFSSGATRFFTPGIGDATEIEGQILVQVDAPNFFVVEGFARFTRMQGSEPGLDGLLDSSSFRAAVGHLSVHRVLGGPTFMGGQLPFFGAGCSAGVSWERDKVFDPSDPNIWAVGCGPRVQVPRGSLTVKVGHHGSVGGFAAFGELVINQGPSVRYVATYAIPFDAARFRQNPGTFTGGIQVDVWSRKF